MSPLFQLVLFNNCLIQQLIPWMSPLFQLVLFNNCLIQLLIPWMSPLFQLVLFNLLFRWPPLFGRTFYSTFYFIQLEWLPLFGHPYFILITTDLLLFFFLWKKRCLTWDSNPGPLDFQSGCLPLHHHHTLKAIIKLITTPLHSNYQTDHHTPSQQLSN